MPDGSTYGDHLKSLARQGEKIKLPRRLPRALQPVWDAFQEIRKRTPAGLGLSPMTHTQIESYCWLHGIRLTSWEVGCLLELDDLALAHASKKPDEKSKE